MLDIKFIRENPEAAKKLLVGRNIPSQEIDSLLSIDQELREQTAKLEALRSQKNQFNNVVSKLAPEEKREKVKEMKEMGEREASVLALLNAAQSALQESLQKLPNLPADDVPVGQSAAENKIIKTWGTPPEFGFTPKDHLELGEQLDMIDVKTASTVSGPRFAYLKNEAVLLQFALVQYALSVLINPDALQRIIAEHDLAVPRTPFVPVIPPVLVKEETLQRMARLEPKEERYHLPADNLYLVGSAEHALGPMHLDQILPAESLPLRYAGFSGAFRREAGSYGQDTRGIIRVHQFDKLELQSFTLPEHSIAEQNLFVAIQEHLMQSLNIPYRLVMMCTGDMTAPDARQIDLESWIPSQQTFRETHTSDLTTDYQARRLNTRFKRSNGSKGVVHLNDATAFAIGRTLVAILENYQQADGSVVVPPVLRPYCGGLEKISSKLAR